MLQIATGKLFVRAVYRENRLRGTLYTNAVIGHEEIVETAAGRLIPSSSLSVQPQVVSYAFTEKIEAEAQGPNILVSSTVDPYQQDFSVVVAFALNCVCTPDVDLCRRLISGQRGLSTRVAPNSLVRRFFDADLWCQPQDRQFLVDFTRQLIGLPRATFLGVMRSLRTYISGMYRIADDLELAYTLLVASVESLAQDFDGHQSDWESLDERKRSALDAALTGADDAITQRVRQALLGVEHVALGRRFREFVAAHTDPDYFRPTTGVDGARLGRADLKEALGLAYQSRSKYVHQLKELPDSVARGRRYAEIAIEDRATHLTLQGLARLMRNTIIEFVMRQPTIEREPYNYTLERAGVVEMRLAAQYWVWRADGDIRQAGRDKLEGFLEQLAACLLKEQGAAISDLRPVLAVAAEFLPNLERRLRLPYLVLFFGFNWFVSEQERAPIPPAVGALVEQELDEASSEALLAHALADEQPQWPLEEHAQAVDYYYRRRGAKNGLRFPRIFEAAITLALAERYRAVSDMPRCRAVVAIAVENDPGLTSLQELERNLVPERPISWRDVLLPPTTAPA